MALITISAVRAQNVNEWRIYSSYSTINSISAGSEGQIFASTLGGLFLVEDEIIQERYTTVDGMHRLDGVVSAYDEINNRLLIGYPDGVIDLFDVESSTFQKINDIARVEEFASRSVTDIQIEGNEVYVATHFGVVVFDRNEFFVSNSFLTLGVFERGTRVNSISISGDSLYAATTNGIAVGDVTTSLLDNANWENFELGSESNQEVLEIEAVEGITISLNEDSLFLFTGSNWSSFTIPELSSPELVTKTETDILISDGIDIIRYSASGSELIFDGQDDNIRSLEISNNKLLIGTNESGIIQYDITSESQITYNPSGPYLNFFSDLEFDGGVFLASATSQFPQSDPFNPIRGYYVLENGGWSSFNRNTSSVLADFGYATAHTVEISEENFFVGSWGDGVAIQNRSTSEIRVFDRSNSGFSGISANRDFIVISGLDTDSQQNTWAVSFISNLPLNIYSPESEEWTHFPPLPINSDELYYRLFIDRNNKLWIPLIDISNNGEGLLVIDPGNDLFDDSDDTFRKLISSENQGNLPDENVTAIDEDKNGEVWIGTTRGIARFIFPDFIVSSNNPNEFRAQWLINSDTSAVSRFLLRDVNVSTIAVNSANQKWIGSANQGIWLLNEDGSEIIERFTTENSPLLSNNIEDIAINDLTGEVFISTDLGLVSYTEISKEPVSSMDKLKVYPNPFVYSRHEHIIIEDLSDETTIRVVGADGSNFREIATRGGRIQWDGLDSFGNQLSSGVYFLVAIDENGGEKGIGKVVIVR